MSTEAKKRLIEQGFHLTDIEFISKLEEARQEIERLPFFVKPAMQPIVRIIDLLQASIPELTICIDALKKIEGMSKTYPHGEKLSHKMAATATDGLNRSREAAAVLMQELAAFISTPKLLGKG